MAAVQPIATPIGHSLPPEEDHTITLHAPTWDHAVRFRNKDSELFAQMVSMYPRFGPWNQASDLCKAIHSKLSLSPQDDAVLPFVHPESVAAAKEHAFSEHRKENEKDGTKLLPGELKFRVVDIGDVRLYVLVFPAKKASGIMGVWQNFGTGISTRLSGDLLQKIEKDPGSFTVHEFEATGEDDLDILVKGGKFPQGSWLPEVEAHVRLRERIVGLMKRDSLVPAEVAQKLKADDVYLYPTGMAGIYYLHEILTGPGSHHHQAAAAAAACGRRQGTVLVLGAVFHNSWHVFEEESPDGFKHFGKCETSQELDVIEAWLEGESQAGRKINYLFVEFPSNPLLVSTDLKRLRGWADKYSFPIVVDDTVGSFCNVDLLPVADAIVSSLTKSFSGYSNVMAGSVILNPSLPFYTSFLKPAFITNHKNELYSADAIKLLSNSDDYLARSRILNRNAQAIADLAASYSSSSSPSSSSSSLKNNNNNKEALVKKVLYPPYLPSLSNYQAFMRRPGSSSPLSSSPEQEGDEEKLFQPGYGCLLSIEFVDKEKAIAFYDNLHVHKGPHLGAHLTLAMPYNEMVWGSPGIVEEGYHMAYGLALEQVRVSVGLEDEERLVRVFSVAFEAAAAAAAAADGDDGDDNDALVDKGKGE